MPMIDRDGTEGKKLMEPDGVGERGGYVDK